MNFLLFNFRSEPKPNKMSSEDSLPKPAAAIADELAKFSQDQLKTTQTQEKVVLPTKEGEYPCELNYVHECTHSHFNQ